MHLTVLLKAQQFLEENKPGTTKQNRVRTRDSTEMLMFQGDYCKKKKKNRSHSEFSSHSQSLWEHQIQRK